MLVLAMALRLSSFMYLLRERLGYWKQRHAEHKERRADLRGYPIVHVMERLKKIHARSLR